MSKLTISQGLRLAARLKGKLTEHKSRAQSSNVYREDSPPAFAFPSSMERLNAVRRDLTALESRIAVTNAVTRVDFLGRSITLTEAIKTLQETKEILSWLRTVPCAAQSFSAGKERSYDDEGKLSTVEFRQKCDMTEQQRADNVDAFQSDFDALNDLVEKKNHDTELVAL